MQTVKEILDIKGRECWRVAPDTSLHDAASLMTDKQVGSLLVMVGDEVKGLLTERDYVHIVNLGHKVSPDTPVEQVMSTHVLYTRPDHSIEECMALMTDKRVRHLPVIDDGKVVGIVSIGDLVKGVISKQQFIIEQLENYIAG